MNAVADRLFRLFMPYAASRMDAFKASKGRFVHYTSAEAAVNILRQREVWLRNAKYMNDYREVEYGLECLFDAWRSPSGIRLQSFLNQLHPELSIRFKDTFNFHIDKIRFDSFLTCVSEHGGGDEDMLGRLSMWRAYGPGTGVAIVMNTFCFFNETGALEAYTSPVEYLSEESFARKFALLVEGIEAERDFLSGLPAEEIVQWLYQAFSTAALCTKHPGFHEEREWRVVYCPSISSSSLIQREIVNIRGVPQPIHKIRLKNEPDKNLIGVEPDELIERVIIGPTQFPTALYAAFAELLTNVGVKEPHKRIVISHIPIR